MKRINSLISITLAAGLAVASIALAAPAQALPGDLVFTNSVNAGDHGRISVFNSMATSDAADVVIDCFNAVNLKETIEKVPVVAGQTSTYDWSVPSNAPGAEWVYCEITGLVDSTSEVLYFQSVAYVPNVLTAQIAQNGTCGVDGSVRIANGFGTDQSVYTKIQGNGGVGAIVSDPILLAPYGNDTAGFNGNRFVDYHFVTGAGDTTFVVQVLNSADNSVVATSGVQSLCPPPPSFTSGPKFSGPVRVGTKVYCLNTVSSSGTGLTLQYGWAVNNAQISNIASSYTPKAGDLGKTLQCGVVATDSNGQTAAASSIAKVAVGLAPRVISPYYPKITGIPARGKYLAIYVGRWTPAPTAYRCVWYSYSGTKLVRITSTILCTAQFKIPSTYRSGTRLLARLYAYKTGYTTGSRYTPVVKVV